MSIDRLDFDALIKGDLDELITAQVPESINIDYKRDAYGNSDSDKRELLKDISSFANSQGGHLVIGIEEQNGTASSIRGLAGNQDAEIRKLEQIIRSGIEPRIGGVRVKSIDVGNGNFAIVIRIPRSWNPPHRVSAQNHNSFWIRNSSGKHEASMEELKNMFVLASSAIEKTRQFRNERISTIGTLGTPPLMTAEGVFILHIVPVHAFSSANQIDPEDADRNMGLFCPIGASGFNKRYNFDGFITERGGEQNFGYTQIFRNGIIEATKANLVRVNQENIRGIPGLGLEQQIFQHLPNFINGMRTIGVQPPLVIMLTLLNVHRAKYHVFENTWGDEPPIAFDRPNLLLPECVLEHYGEDEDYHRVIQPAFDALWNSAGFSKNLFFSQDGIWTGKVNR